MDRERKNNHPFSTYMLVWLGLLILTGLTVTVASLNLGNLSVLAVIFIITLESALIVWYFMHIKCEDRIFKIMLAVAIFTLVVILLLTFLNTSIH